MRQGAASFAEQLAPVATQLRHQYSSTRPISQITFRILTKTAEASFSSIQKEILVWMSNRAGRKLPPAAWRGEDFTLTKVGAQPASAVNIENPRYWASRLDDADKAVPMRSWVTEAAIASSSPSDLRFGCRLWCVTRGEDVPYIPSVPGMVRQIAERHDAVLDGRRLDGQPWIIETESDVDSLVAFLSDQNRKRDVILISLPEKSDDINDAIVPCPELTQSVLGAAHVAVITGPAAFNLTDAVGKEFSVFQQAIRIYRPKLDFDRDRPFDHPLTVADRIAGWSNEGPEAFRRFIVREALRHTVRGTDLESEIPSFAAVLQLATERRRERDKSDGASERELLELVTSEVGELKQRLNDQTEVYDGLVQVAESERDAAKSEVEELKSQISALRARIDYLKRAGHRPPIESEIHVLPPSFEDLDGWAREHLAGAVVVHNRAVRAAKKSDFENVHLAYRALLLLRDWYVPMRREGGLVRKQGYELACQDLGLDEAPCFAGSRMGEEGDSYYIQFGGRRRLLDRHLKGSNSRDPRYGFRLYFFWDDESEHAVVGWLPSHLPNRVS